MNRLIILLFALVLMVTIASVSAQWGWGGYRRFGWGGGYGWRRPYYGGFYGRRWGWGYGGGYWG